MTGRSLPNSSEAEGYLLSCCMIEGSDVVARCIDAGVTVETYYDTKHGIIFGRLVDLHRRGLACEVALVAEELKASQQLDVVGGYPFLTQISSAIPTTAQADYFIETVRRHEVSRKRIRTATALAESEYAGDVDASQKLSAELHDLETGSRSIARELVTRRFNPAVVPPDPRVIYRLGKIPICTAGNLANINAEAKVGKSAFAGAMLAAPMAASGADCFTVNAENPLGHALLHFETEHSSADWHRILGRARQRARIDSLPPWLVSYLLTGLSAQECRACVERALLQAHRDFGGIFAAIIDGVADLVTDPNDGEECFPFVMQLHGLAMKYDTAIINVLHVNPGTAKTRGHLGSQLERKAETNLTLEKDEEGATVVYGLKQRGAGITKADGPRFRWGDAEEMHVSTETVRAARDQAQADRMSELIRDVFVDKTAMTYSALKSAIALAEKCSDRTASGRISEMRRLKLITRFPPNLYARAS